MNVNEVELGKRYFSDDYASFGKNELTGEEEGQVDCLIITKRDDKRIMFQFANCDPPFNTSDEMGMDIDKFTNQLFPTPEEALNSYITKNKKEFKMHNQQYYKKFYGKRIEHAEGYLKVITKDKIK